jgi:diguanylate cyclase
MGASRQRCGVEGIENVEAPCNIDNGTRARYSWSQLCRFLLTGPSTGSAREQMLWNKKRAPAESAPGPGAASQRPNDSPDTSSKALDVLTTLLRLYGQYCFDTDTIDASVAQADCNAWATRISLADGRPSVEGGIERAPQPAPGPFRDWAGLVGFVQERRRSESEYVVRSLRSFREAILCFAECLGQTLGDERASDARIEQQLGTLSTALEARDPRRIGAEAQRVVEAVRRAIANRRQRELEQTGLLGARLQDLREELAEARKKADVDALTQLSNRAAFDQHVRHLASLGGLLGEAPCLILADLDHFKTINDNYGHPAGDEVLRQVSRCLSRTFLRKQDFVCRYGGEEFAAVLIDTTLSQAQILSERLLENVRGLMIQHAEHEIRPTASLGLAALGPGENASDWLARADAALYRAKHAGRDRLALAPANGLHVRAE